MKETVLDFDRTLTKWIAATFGQSTRPFFSLVTHLGDPLTVGIITSSVIGYGIYSSNMRLLMAGFAIPLTVIIGAVLKVWFERARPMTEYALNMKLKTFSFPSGHSNGSTISYGLLAYLLSVSTNGLWSNAAVIVVAAIPLFVGLSRVYLGAHFPSDVLAGWILGLTSLLLVITFVRPLL